MHIKVNSTGQRAMGRLAKGSDLLQALTAVCQEAGIKLGGVRAIGAVARARVGYYDQTGRVYNFIEMDQDLEILTLTGNVSLKGGQPFVHAHVTLGDDQDRAFGGHLAEGCEVFACEFEIEQYASDQVLARAFDEETGLVLWPK